MQVLAIGNSFSQDAMRYLHRLAAAAGEDITAVNLYIGGCTLRQHYINMLTDSKSYVLQYNGESTGFYVSIKEALINRDWDYITLQQGSHESFKADSYQPYLKELSACVRTYVPKAKQLIHQTWAYEQGSERLMTVAGYDDQAAMFADIKAAYARAADDIAADGVIPSGELFQKLLAAGIEKVHRDTFHASRGLGRYALGLLWYRVLTGKDVDDLDFSDFDVPVSAREIAIAKRCVTEAARQYA